MQLATRLTPLCLLPLIHTRKDQFCLEDCNLICMLLTLVVSSYVGVLVQVPKLLADNISYLYSHPSHDRRHMKHAVQVSSTSSRHSTNRIRLTPEALVTCAAKAATCLVPAFTEPLAVGPTAY